MAPPPVSSMVRLVTVVTEGLLYLKKQKKTVKSTKPNTRCCTHCYSTTVCAATVIATANHVNQLDFIMQFIRRV